MIKGAKKSKDELIEPLLSNEVSLPNPYFDARREWNERYGAYIARAKNWRIMAFISGLTAVFAVMGLVAISFQNKIVPYVVEVDSLGNAQAVKPATEASLADERVVRAYLGRFNNDFRTISTDLTQEKATLYRLYAMLPQGSPALHKMNEYFEENSPFAKAASQTVTVDISNILPLTDKTWQVEWVETTRNLQGALLEGQRHFKASISIAHNPPTNEKQILINPLGVYVTDINWTQVVG